MEFPRNRLTRANDSYRVRGASLAGPPCGGLFAARSRSTEAAGCWRSRRQELTLATPPLDRPWQCAWGYGALLVLGCHCTPYRGDISVGDAARQRAGLPRHRFLCHTDGSRRAHVRRPDDPAVRDDRVPRRLHDLLLIQSADAQSRQRRRVAVCRVLHWCVRNPLPVRRMANLLALHFNAIKWV